MNHSISLNKTIAALLVCIASASGVAPTVAGANDVAAELADGKPWNARTLDGESMKLTLNGNGTAKMSFGFLSRDLTWKANEEGICLDGMPGGVKCMSFVAVEGGFAAVESGKTGLTLTRP